MSKLETNTIDTVSGTTNLTIGSTNSSTVTFENGAVTGHMYPSFFTRKLGTQALTSDTDTKLIPDDEVYDTDSAYDTSTGRFTVPTGKGGKYFFTYGFSMQNQDDLTQMAVNIKVNGSFIDGTNVLSSSYSFLATAYNGSNTDDPSATASALVVLSAGDYVEMWGRQRDNTTENARYLRFGGFRIGA
jgi:hypothetical protein